MLRSPLLVTWKCVRARSAKVHACGAQLKTRISRNFGEDRESAVEIPRKKNSLTAALAANFERVRTTAEREKNKIGRAFYSIFQNLPDYLADIFEIWQNLANLKEILQILQILRHLQNVC